MNPCQRHSRYNCTDSYCVAQSNVGQPAIDPNGGIAIGIGGGLTINPSDGHLGMSVGGINLEL